MLRDFFVFHSKPIILGLILVFILLKWLLIFLYGVKGDRIRLFFITLSILSKSVVDNTFYEDLQSYYRVSNKVNKYFYLTIAILGALYYVFKFYLPHR